MIPLPIYYIDPDSFLYDFAPAPEDVGLSGSVLTNVSVMSMNPISSNDANGLKAIVLDLIGDYDAIVVEYEYTSQQGYSNYVREIQYDFPWLVSAGIFAIVLYCTLRMGAKILCNR